MSERQTPIACLTFARSDYPTEASARKVIEQQVILQNRKAERVKVGALFGALQSREHIRSPARATVTSPMWIQRKYDLSLGKPQTESRTPTPYRPTP
jgi:hypothetical protein